MVLVDPATILVGSTSTTAEYPDTACTACERAARAAALKVKRSLLKTNRSKITLGLEPLYGDALSAKSFEVLTLVFSTDCSPIDGPQTVLKITRFGNI